MCIYQATSVRIHTHIAFRHAILYTPVIAMSKCWPSALTVYSVPKVAAL